MRLSRTLLHTAVLGSTLALAAGASSAGAYQFQPEQKRILAARGMRAAAPQAAATLSAHAADTFTVLHNFGGSPNDGANSGAEVSIDKSGNIWGTTDFGGSNTDGTIFKIAGGTESVVHSFGGAGDGSEPDGAISILSNGDMIGTTSYGGATENGNIWKLAADGTYSVLHDFTSDEGNFARGKLIRDKKGNFYGTCLFGGSTGDGTVFKFTSKGKLTVLYTFTGGNDGEFPEHGVVMDKAGNLYGVTAFGGADGDGAIYKIARDGTFSTLYSFTGGADGSFLYGGLAIDKDGNLYGSADSDGANGNGTVFKLAANGTFSVLYSFTGGADGGSPEGDMLLIGKTLYSTNTTSGANGEGVVYQLSLKGREKTLADFSDSNGNYYSAGLTPAGKTFYGTAEYGGATGNGTVFSVTKK
jgi:uncharacterized repeat protein (TIGR03803 family)